MCSIAVSNKIIGVTGCVLVDISNTSPAFCAGCWSALYKTQDQWIRADLGTAQRIKSVTTQGHPMFAQWVTSYYISYSLDGTNWMDISTLYSGNVDQNTKKTNNLPANTAARYVRLRPQTWQSHISLRFDVTGCVAPSKISPERCGIVVRHTTIACTCEVVSVTHKHKST